MQTEFILKVVLDLKIQYRALNAFGATAGSLSCSVQTSSRWVKEPACFNIFKQIKDRRVFKMGFFRFSEDHDLP